MTRDYYSTAKNTSRRELKFVAIGIFIYITVLLERIKYFLNFEVLLEGFFKGKGVVIEMYVVLMA